MIDLKELSQTQQGQEDQYIFPYHYIPHWQHGRLQIVRYWGMSSFTYLGRIELIKQHLQQTNFQSLLDVGCGDGRLLSELSKYFDEKQLRGVDYSARAIRLAQALNPHLDYQQADITIADIPHHDVVTLIEVLEHIPILDVPSFVQHLVDLVSPNGTLILTVPHQNVPLAQRHYQHFSDQSLRDIFAPYFLEMDIRFINSSSKQLAFLQKLIGGRGRYFIVSYSPLVTKIYHYFLKHHLRTTDETRCRGLLMIAHNKKT